MSLVFTADEIYEMAERIEHNGAEFYRAAAAEGGHTAEHRHMLNQLADMEDEHEQTFKSMRAELSGADLESKTFDPEGQQAQYLRALADTRIFFEKKVDTSSMEEILKSAIVDEKDSILFYLGMMEVVPSPSGQEKVDRIMKEEMEHVRLLGEDLLALKG